MLLEGPLDMTLPVSNKKSPRFLRIANRLARIGAGAELFLAETGHPRDVWELLRLEADDCPMTFHLRALGSTRTANALREALGEPGTSACFDIGPLRVVLSGALGERDPWAAAPPPGRVPTAWLAAIAATAARAALHALSQNPQLDEPTQRLLWVAHAAGAAVDRHARLRPAPRTRSEPPRVAALHPGRTTDPR